MKQPGQSLSSMDEPYNTGITIVNNYFDCGSPLYPQPGTGMFDPRLPPEKIFM